MSARFAVALAALALAGACSAPLRPARPAPTPAPTPQPTLRIGAAAQEGGARRRASTQLVLDGLASEMRGDAREATVRFEDALKVDATNPLASLAFARSEIFGGDVDRGLAHLDRFEALAGARAGAAAHVAGLRGAALMRLGKRALALPYLEEARALAPDVWGDARLDARELR